MMNKEIKEILDRLDYNEWEVDLYKVPITWLELYDIRDYITNLQEKVNQYENPDDMTLFYMWLDEKAKDKMKQLQEENEHLRTDLNTYQNTVIEVNKECNSLFNHLTKKDLDYKSRCDKAIEYINEMCLCTNGYCDYGDDLRPEHIVKILQGSDKE